MRGNRWGSAALLGLGLVVVACAAKDDDVRRDTPETRCDRLCAPPRENPCFNASSTDTTCRTTCLARLTGKSEECQSCIHVKSGWTGHNCSCDGAFGDFGSASCETCSWKSSSNSCSTTVGNSCPAAACEGFLMAPVGDPGCASICGETPIVDAGSD